MRLRHRVTLERRARVPDGAGGSAGGFSAVAALWASLAPVEPRPEWSGDGSSAPRITHRLMLRWRPDLDGASRFRLGARVFDVHAVADADERRRRLVCLIEEVTP